MPGQAPMASGERDTLLSFLRQQRYVLSLTAYGLTDEQARRSPSASSLSVGGLVKHLGFVENSWLDLIEGLPYGRDDEAYGDAFTLLDGETLAGVLAAYERAAERAERVIGAIEDLDRPVPVPSGVPWFPQDLDAWSVRWVLVHLIAETARHAGHADIVRESVDGATAFPLMAAAEGWPATPWIQPWQPPADSATSPAGSPAAAR